MSIGSYPSPLSGRSWKGRRIGLFGGSFNPAHQGHLSDSLYALRALHLDQVWWLVSPQNPLKPAKGMAPLPERVAGARRFVRHPRILVTDIETALGTRYTVDTLRALRQRYPGTHFIWIMGAENLSQIRLWKHWTRIFHMVTVAVFDRPTYALKAQQSMAARRFARYRAAGTDRFGLATAPAPGWGFFHTPLNAISSTAIRQAIQKGKDHRDDR